MREGDISRAHTDYGESGPWVRVKMPMLLKQRERKEKEKMKANIYKEEEMDRGYSGTTDCTKIPSCFYPDREGKALERSELHFNHS